MRFDRLSAATSVKTSLRLITVPAVFPTDTGETRLAPTFRKSLAGGFQRWDPGAGSQSMACAPCRFPVRVLVPVFAFCLFYHLPVKTC